MGRRASVVSRIAKERCFLGLSVVALLLSGCGSGGGSASGLSVRRTLTAQEAEDSLRHLRFPVKLHPVQLPKGATGAFAGRALGRDGTHLRFGVALGPHASPVPVPKSGVLQTTAIPSAGITVTNDTLIETSGHEFRTNPTIHTTRQEHIADQMVEQLEQALCVAAIGEKCGI